MIVSIHQPQYLPYLGYFHKIVNSDCFVHLDNVQFQKNGIQNRNKIKNDKGWSWLSIPVIQKKEQNINEVKILPNSNWAIKHLKTVKACYSKSKHFKDNFEHIQDVYEKSWENLIDVNIEFVKLLCRMLDINTNFVFASEISSGGISSERLINICKSLNADTYLSGPGGQQYMDLNLFEKEGIRIVWQDFKPPEYEQQFPKVGFIPNLSILDALFNCGNQVRSFIAHQKKGSY